MLSTILALALQSATITTIPVPVSVYVSVDGFEETLDTTLSIPQKTIATFSPDDRLNIKIETLQDYKNQQVTIAEIKGPVLVSSRCTQKVKGKCMASLLLGTAKGDFFLYPGKNDIQFSQYKIEIIMTTRKVN